MLARALDSHRRGRLVEAQAICHDILTIDPNHADSLHLLGVMASQSGAQPLAIELIGKAIAINDRFAPYHSNLGNALRASGRLEEAVAAYRRAIKLKPDYGAAHNNLGTVLAELGRLKDAASAYRQAITLSPDYAPAQVNLGNVLRDLGALDDALAAYRRAVAIKPEDAEAQYRLGVVLWRLGQLDEAAAAYGAAIAAKPGMAAAQSGLGIVLRERGQLTEAMACYRKAIAIQPDLIDAHWNLGLALLAAGDYAAGWEQYEWRLKRDQTGERFSAFAQPLWRGEPADGKTLFLWTEQGMGDAIHFVRYAPLAAQRGWRVILETPEALRRLFAGIAARDGVTLLAQGDPPLRFDAHCPLLSLPRAFGTTAQSIPAHVPYLYADPNLAAVWRDRLDGPGRTRIGIVWHGKPSQARNRSRSIEPALLGGAFRRPDIGIVSLQKTARPDELAALGVPVLNAGPELGDFAETAALIANLDLVITVDTSVCHLAGALGVPTWVLLDFSPDWRWLRDKDDNPWYPTMRLFRQQAIGDWPSVVVRLQQELDRFVDAHPPTLSARP
jgi:tetratricopeptide (TPR) repeat protein